MEVELEKKIEETVLEILKSSDMDATTEFQVRKSAAEKLGIDLSQPDRKKFVRKVVESYLDELQLKADQAQQQADVDNEEQDEVKEEEEEEDDDEEGSRKRKKSGPKEYDDEGNLIICRLSKNRKVTINDFRGRRLVSIREYFTKDNVERPTSKGISLTAEQWRTFRKNMPAIEKAVKKMESSLD